MSIQKDDHAAEDGVWRKSSFSNPDGNECVEVALGEDEVGVRDSKNRTAGLLAFDALSWRQFVDHMI